jgi:hypothetical protein
MEGHVLCHSEHVWHPYVHKKAESTTIDTKGVTGTHGGVVGMRGKGRLSDEARLVRRAKNARNFSRRGVSTHPKGTQRRGT